MVQFVRSFVCLFFFSSCSCIDFSFSSTTNCCLATCPEAHSAVSSFKNRFLCTCPELANLPQPSHGRQNRNISSERVKLISSAIAETYEGQRHGAHWSFSFHNSHLPLATVPNTLSNLICAFRVEIVYATQF